MKKNKFISKALFSLLLGLGYGSIYAQYGYSSLTEQDYNLLGDKIKNKSVDQLENKGSYQEDSRRLLYEGKIIGIKAKGESVVNKFKGCIKGYEIILEKNLYVDCVINNKVNYIGESIIIYKDLDKIHLLVDNKLMIVK